MRSRSCWWLAAAVSACAPQPARLDVSSPHVLSVVPIDGATDVGVGAEVTLCLDRPMDPATVTPDVVVLSRDDGHRTQPLAVTVSLSPDASCLSASPWSPLAPASHYRLELQKGLLSAGGLAISNKAVQFASGFSTVAPAATAAMLIPQDGMLDAPTDLAQVLLWFSAPVRVPDGGSPFTLEPGGALGSLSADGRRGRASLLGADSETVIHVRLSMDLVDDSGQSPLSAGPLEFRFGDCAEGDSPSLGAGLILARDRTAILTFAVDRPGLCAAGLADPACPDAGSLEGPAECQSPYDPCGAHQLCLCTVPLIGLCPGDSVTAVPEATGFDGQLGAASPVVFRTSPPLPGLVLTEVRGGGKSSAFVEVQNRSGAPIDLLGLTLADCGLTLGCSTPKSMQRFGSFAGLGSTTLDPNGYALLVDASHDPTSVPPDALLLSPQGQAALLSLSSTRAQSLAVFLPGLEEVVSSYDGSLLPRTGASIERIDPGTADPMPRNWALSTASGGTPGACNSVTAGGLCDARLP